MGPGGLEFWLIESVPTSFLLQENARCQHVAHIPLRPTPTLQRPAPNKTLTLQKSPPTIECYIPPATPTPTPSIAETNLSFVEPRALPPVFGSLDVSVPSRSSGPQSVAPEPEPPSRHVVGTPQQVHGVVSDQPPIYERPLFVSERLSSRYCRPAAVDAPYRARYPDRSRAKHK